MRRNCRVQRIFASEATSSLLLPVDESCPREGRGDQGPPHEGAKLKTRPTMTVRKREGSQPSVHLPGGGTDLYLTLNKLEGWTAR